MSAAATLVHADVVSVVEAISPVCTIEAKKFRHTRAPRLGLFADKSTGTAREFAVYPDRAGPILDVSDGTGQLREYDFIVEVAYPTGFQLTDLSTLILSDSYDLVKALRVETSNTIDSVLFNRTVTDERLDRGSEITWYLRQSWRCTVWETY